MEDRPYPYPVALHWTQEPESLKKLKNKLLLYFQKRSESNGGECEIPETDCSRGYVLIHFKEENARDGVLQKDVHELKLPGGKKMRLDVRSVGADGGGRSEGSSEDYRANLTPQPPDVSAPSDKTQDVTQDPPSSLLLIENLQDSYTSDMLNLLVENISEKNEDTDFHVERIPEKQSAVITFTCDIDILRFVEMFSRNSRIRALKMTAKLLEESRSVRVEGLLPTTPEDYITLYFENPKYGGPGSVEDTLAILEEGAALVTFTTIEVAKKVLGRKHQFSKKEVSVYPYYPSQDIVLYGKQRPHIQKPEPLTFPISPYILEFILSNTQQTDNMEKTMAAHTCEIKWPDLLCPNPVITLNFPDTLSTHLRTLAQLVPTWKDTVHAEFSRLISKYRVIEYKMDQSVWDAIREHVSSSTYNEVLIKPDVAAEKVFLAGMSLEVMETFRQLVEETTKQVERKNEGKTETLSMSPALYQIMCNSGLQKKILDQVPELKMDYDVPRKEIRLSGLRDEVLTAKREILNMQIQLENTTPQRNPHLAPVPMSTNNEGISNLLSGSQYGLAEDRSSEDKTTPDNEVTQEPPSSLVLIEKVQDSYTPEMLNLLVENISQKTEGKDFYVERIPQIQSAVVTFTCDIDILRFIKNFSSNHRVQNKLTARPLEESRIVRVENLPETIPEMFLAAFFENPKQGGGRVKEIVMLPEERAALITFHDTEDVKRVLKKEHVFSKRKISVYPYYPMLSIALYGQQGPCIEIPKPIEFNISPYILQHICNNEELKNNIDKEMTDKHCEIKWPDQDCQNPALQLIFPPSLATHLRSVAKLVPKWNEEVCNEFSLLISKYKVLEYKMDQSVWDAIREHVNSSDYDRVLIKPDFDSEKVFLAGMSKDVTEIDPTFRKLVEETTKQVERKNEGKTETLSMSPALYQIMCNSGLKKKILDQVPELKMDYDVPRKEIRLSGLRDEVLTAKCEILHIKQEMKSKSIQMNPHLVQFLTSTDNEELSCLLFVRHNINALLEIDDDNVGLTAYSKKDLMEAEEQLKQELVCRQICVEAKSVLNSPEWRSLHSHLLESCNAEQSTVLILEPLSGAENNVAIAGLSSNVDKCYQQVSDFLEENTSVEKNIQCKSLVVVEFLKEEKKQVLDELKNDNLSVAIRNKNIRFKGPKLYVSKAYTSISDVLRSLFSDTLNIDKPGAKKFCLEHEDLYITMAKNKFRCLLYFQKEEEEKTAEDETEEMEGPQYQGFSRALSSRMDRNAAVSNMAALGTSLSSQAGARSSPDRLVLFDTMRSFSARRALRSGSIGFFGTVSTPVAGTHEMKIGSVTYQVKTGDITKEDTDVIVNSTDRTFTMRSGVSKAILDAAGQSVVDECTRLGKKPYWRWEKYYSFKDPLQSKKLNDSRSVQPPPSSSIQRMLSASNALLGEDTPMLFRDFRSQGNKEHIVTQSGNLPCKKILHKAGAYSAKGIKTFITEALTECARLRASSVAFPAIGTGMGMVSSSTVADSILETVADFAQSPQSIQTVKVVIFQQQMLNDFHTSMKKKEGKATLKYEGFMSTMKNSIKENIEPAIIHLCAESRDAVDKTKSWLLELIMKEQNENIITDDCIREFNDKDYDAFSLLQKKYQVTLTFDFSGSTIKVLGLCRDVLEVSNTIQEMIKTVRDKKTRDREAELCSNLVEWGYLDGCIFIPFGKMVNLDLEKAKSENIQSLSIDINGVKHTVSVAQLSARDPRGKTLKLQRNSKHGS